MFEVDTTKETLHVTLDKISERLQMTYLGEDQMGSIGFECPPYGVSGEFSITPEETRLAIQKPDELSTRSSGEKWYSFSRDSEGIWSFSEVTYDVSTSPDGKRPERRAPMQPTTPIASRMDEVTESVLVTHLDFYQPKGFFKKVRALGAEVLAAFANVSPYGIPLPVPTERRKD